MSISALVDHAQMTEAYLRTVVHELSTRIGERNLARYDHLAASANYILHELGSTAAVVSQQFFLDGPSGKPCQNIIGELTGVTRPREIIVIGAHYDSAVGTPGANDNATGVAAMLQLARLASLRPHRRTLRFVAFCNEEEPYFDTPSMGSKVYAKGCAAARDNIVGAIILDCLGSFSDSRTAQSYPFPFDYFCPPTGNFILFLANFRSLRLMRRIAGSFRRSSEVPCLGLPVPMYKPFRLSDHFSFYRSGYRAVLVTDTGPFRYPHYHRRTDTEDKIDFGKAAATVLGLQAVVERWAE